MAKCSCDDCVGWWPARGTLQSNGIHAVQAVSDEEFTTNFDVLKREYQMFFLPADGVLVSMNFSVYGGESINMDKENPLKNKEYNIWVPHRIKRVYKVDINNIGFAYSKSRKKIIFFDAKKINNMQEMEDKITSNPVRFSRHALSQLWDKCYGVKNQNGKELF